MRRGGISRMALAVAIAACGLAGCGASGENATQVVRASFRAGAAARSVHIVGVVPVRGTPVRIDLEVGRNSAEGYVTLEGVRVQLLVVNDAEYGQTTARAGAELLDATLPRRLRIGWIKLPRVNPALAKLISIPRLFSALSRSSAGMFHRVGIVRDDGQRAARVGDSDGGHLDVAMSGAPLPLDLVEPIEHAQLRFYRWNRPLSIVAPAHWTSVATIRARRPPVHSVAVHGSVLLPSGVHDGVRRFHAVGVGVEFDYPADFEPLKLASTRRAGNNHGNDVAVGLGNDLLLVVTQFSRLAVPVNTRNAAVLAPAFEHAIDALAGHSVAERTTSIRGHPLLSFAGFTLSDAYGVRTLRAYNVFFGDTYAELQCQYMTAEQTAGISACNEMLRTLTVIPSG
ncbi:MAG TPA: hypothetical protein VIJ33_02445 [Solirubrobacteraceae bacterium]